MKIDVDPAACDGFGYCAEILPDLLSLDEWGFPVVDRADIPEDLVRAATKAVRLCPRRALRVSSVGLTTRSRST
jgi:ferredoxin